MKKNDNERQSILKLVPSVTKTICIGCMHIYMNRYPYLGVASPATVFSVTDELIKLETLRIQGVITEEEFNRLKRSIVTTITSVDVNPYTSNVSTDIINTDSLQTMSPSTCPGSSSGVGVGSLFDNSVDTPLRGSEDEDIP